MIRRLVLLCGFLSLTAATLYGQGMGTILGTVQDPSGLGIPNAQVTALLADRGLTRTVKTDTLGDYIFTVMPVGTYTVTVEQQGFRAFRHAGIVLDANANARVDIRLEVGSVSQQISVTSEAAPVDTHSSEVGTLIDNRDVTELPINGRSVVALAALLPGVSDLFAPQMFTDDRGGPTMSVAGSRDNQNLFLFDGVQHQNLFLNTGLNYPPPDALQEVEVLTNTFSAQYGHNAGSVFNVVSKSGTDKIHGNAWEFYRGAALNARNFFSATTPGLVQNQFGGAIGGPIIKDKLFIFGEFEGLRVKPSAVPTEAFPLTADERAGYFSTPTTNPATGVLYPKAACPSSPSSTCYFINPATFDTVAKNLLSPSVMPLPNAAGNAWVGSFASPESNNQILVRGDYNAGHHTITARYNRNSGFTTWYGGSIPAYQPGRQDTRVDSSTLSDTWVITPTLLNEFRVSFNRFYSPTRLTDPTSLNAFGGTFPTLSDWMTPGFHISGRLDLGDGGSNSATATNNTEELNDSINWTKGRHTMKIGFQLLDLLYANNSFWETSPEFTFDGSFTGNPAADFALGKPVQLVIASPMLQQVGSEFDTNYYIQDDWKVSKRLTLNLGLRYELPLPWVQPNNFWGTLHLGQQSTVIPNAPLGMVYPGDAGVPRGLVPTPKHDFAPRIGLAWDPRGDGRTSVRVAYGIFYDATNAQIIQNTGQPFRYTWYIPAPYSLTNPLNGQPPIPLTVNLKNPQFLGVQDIIYPDPTVTTPYVQAYNLNVQHQVTKDLMVEVGYFGKQSRHLWIGTSPNPAAFTCLTGCANPATIANENSRATYQPGFSVSNLLNATEGSGRYNALEIKVIKRLSHSVSAQGAYTYASSLDDASSLYLSSSTPQPYDLHTQWGPSDFFQRHTLSTSWVWNLPKTGSSNPALRQAVNGWEASGLIAVHSGEPLNVTTGEDSALSGTPLQRPNEVGNPYLSGLSLNAKVQGMYNYQAYAFPNTGAYGNVGRNSLFGPGSAVTNLGVFKNFRLYHESDQLQFRAEFFNLFNRANFFNPSGTLSAGSNMFALTSADSARVIQFALKLSF